MSQYFNADLNSHIKAECPNPKVFNGTCHICEKQGHPAALCPDKPPPICKNCKKEGHTASECKDNMVMDLSDVPDVTEEVAWKNMKTASDESDLDDFRDAVKSLSKANPSLTFVDIENGIRRRKLKYYLIGLVCSFLLL